MHKHDMTLQFNSLKPGFQQRFTFDMSWKWLCWQLLLKLTECQLLFHTQYRFCITLSRLHRQAKGLSRLRRIWIQQDLLICVDRFWIYTFFVAGPVLASHGKRDTRLKTYDDVVDFTSFLIGWAIQYFGAMICSLTLFHAKKPVYFLHVAA